MERSASSAVGRTICDKRLPSLGYAGEAVSRNGEGAASKMGERRYEMPLDCGPPHVGGFWRR